MPDTMAILGRCIKGLTAGLGVGIPVVHAEAWAFRGRHLKQFFKTGPVLWAAQLVRMAVQVKATASAYGAVHEISRQGVRAGVGPELPEGGQEEGPGRKGRPAQQVLEVAPARQEM